MNTKIIIGIVTFTILLVIGAVFVLSDAPAKPNLEKTNGAKIEISEKSFDFKDIAYSGGIVTHSFQIKNIGDKDLQLANLATSCMCTKSYIKTPESTGPKMGMQGMSKPSGWVGILRSGEEGSVIAEFDPAFHGPQGVGSILRNVSFETNDPDNPYVELSFSGVVKK